MEEEVQMRFVHALGLCALVFAATAQAGDTNGYLVDTRGNIIKSSNTGLCVRSTRWSEQKADADCLARAKKAMMASRK
jgi:hypothetical protein